MISNKICPGCEGARLREEARNVRIGTQPGALTLHEISGLPLAEAREHFLTLQLVGNKALVAEKILKEITEEKDSLVLFIDEIHTIVGAGQGGGEGGLDIANTFKPALARGELNLIGVYDFQRMNQIIIAYHAVCSGEVKLSPELVDYKLYGFDEVMCWPAGTGYALADWLTSRGYSPRFVDWSRK